MKTMRIVTGIFAVSIAAALLTGCGSDSNSTAAEENAFKKPDKSALKPPPGDAMKPPANFSSSLNGETKPPTQANGGQ